MKIKISILIFILAVIFSNSTVFSVENISLTLEDLIEEALSNNPEIKVALNEWEAARFKVPQEGSLPDPSVRYTYFGESVETRVGPQEHKYGGSLTIPFPSKLFLKSKAQMKKADIAGEKYEAVKREIINELKFRYYDIYWVDQAIEITGQEKSVVERVEKVAQRKYETKRAGQQDVIRAQIEIANFIDKLMQLRQNRKTLVARLNNILSRPQGADITLSPGVDMPEFTYSLDELRQMALGSKQELLAAEMDVERAGYEKTLAKLDYVPDLTVGFDYIQVGKGYTNMSNDGQDAWMTMFSVNVPLWFNKLSARVKEKKALLEARAENANHIRDKTLYEVEDVYYKILTYRDIVALYRSALVPQTEQAMEATRAGYETGNVNFIDWLDSERVLLHTRLAYHKAVVDYLKSVALLERITGRDLWTIRKEEEEK